VARTIGFVLILLGLAGLAWGGLTWKNEKTTVDLGAIEMNVTEKRTLPIPPLAGAVAVVAGLALVVTDKSRRSNP
jgi:hypothetical protein